MNNKREKVKKVFLRTVVSFAILFFYFSTNVFSWTAPTANPPSNDLPRPLHIGIAEQLKEGNLGTKGYPLIIQPSSSLHDRILITAAAVGSDRFDGTLTNADLTAARTWTLPNVTGTIALTSDLSRGLALGTTATAAGTVAKTATISGYTLTTGDLLAITFTNGNSVNALTLDINSTGAKNIRLANVNVDTVNFTLATDSTVLMYYDGTYFQVMGSQRRVDTDTASAADDILKGSNSGTQITYAPYTDNQAANLRFYTHATDPTGTNRLNIGAHFHSTRLFAGDGTAAAPSLSFSTSTGTGIYRPASNEIGLSTGGSERVRVDANGNVAIGTVSPGSKLDVTSTALGVTQTNTSGLALVNTTAAAVGAQQISPALRWRGFGWKTDATAGSQPVEFRSFVVPVQGTANPSGYLTFQSSVNSGVYSDVMTLTSEGMLTTAGGITNNHTTLATRMASTASEATQIPVFIADPASTTRTLVTRTPTQLVQDGGGLTGSGSAGQATFWTGTSAVSGDNAFWWDNTNKRLGIGTSSPTAALHLKAGTGAANTAPLKLTAGTVLATIEAGALEFTNSETGLTFTAVGTRRQVVLDTAIQTLSSKTYTSPVVEGDITFTNISARGVLIAASGSGTVGRGLSIKAGSTVAGGTNIAGGNTHIESGAGTGTGVSSILFRTGTTLASGTTLQTVGTKMTILGNGNVGIGTETPIARLDVRGDSNTPTGIGENYATYVFGYNRPGLLVHSAGWSTNDDDIARFSGITTGFSEAPRMVIKGKGNVGIGTTIPGSKLDVTTTALGVTQTNTSGLALVNTTAAAVGAQQISPALRWSGFGWKTDATAESQPVEFRSFVVPVQGTANPSGYLTFQSSVNSSAYSDMMAITSGGNVGIGTTSPSYNLEVNGDVGADAYYYTSDIRLKEDIKPLENSLSKILKLEPISYKFKKDEDEKEKFGFSAQQLQTIFPQLVSEGSDGYLSIDGLGLMAPLLDALKTQQGQIQEQRKRINILKREVDSLQKQIDDLNNRVGRVELN